LVKTIALYGFGIRHFEDLGNAKRKSGIVLRQNSQVMPSYHSHASPMGPRPIQVHFQLPQLPQLRTSKTSLARSERSENFSGDCILL